MELGLQGAKVLVTAASQGLGAATARRFSMEGASVVINSRNLEKLQSTAASINEETGNPVFTIACDVSDKDATIKMVDQAAEMLGGLDVLVTNAGGPPGGTFDKLDLDVWEPATRLSFLSAVYMVKAALPHLRQSDKAAILAIQSVSVKEPIANLTTSNSVRLAVIGLMNTLSQELGPEGIRCNSILPAWTHTERVTELLKGRAEANSSSVEEEEAKIANAIPLKRIGKPEEFANAAVFLCSPAASFISGVAMPVDGGLIKATL